MTAWGAIVGSLTSHCRVAEKKGMRSGAASSTPCRGVMRRLLTALGCTASRCTS